MSLEEILCQAMQQLGYYATEVGPVYTRGGLYQSSFKFWTTPDPTVEQLFTVYGKALPRRSEAKDSTLIRALIFIVDALGTRLVMLTMFSTYILSLGNVGYEFVKSTISKCEFLRLIFSLF